MGSHETLVLIFNAYTGKLQEGYRMDNVGRKIGRTMRPAELLELMAKHPDARCSPLTA